ncbi:malto-oligosyltrehalose synthase [Paracidovorax wautersii]|uniref:malto-oligosyltrehalose synthase n=1 Tax=Paracidovorax wautersii TaxID=1177982 RepID=UPI0031D95842
MHLSTADLAQRAAQAGIATEYTDFWGHHVQVDGSVLDQALTAMGEHTQPRHPEPVVVEQGSAGQVELPADCAWSLHADEDNTTHPIAQGHGHEAQLPADLPAGYYRLHAGGEPHRLVIVAPAQCWVAQSLRSGERWWGVTAQMYSLRSATSWGIGDFTDLAALAGIAAAQGAAFIGLSPLHALRPDATHQASPYAPSSRLALNLLHIDVTAVPELAQCRPAQDLIQSAGFQQRLAEVQASDTVRYEEVAALKEAALAQLWAHFSAQELRQGTERGRAFEAFARRHASTLGLHALYEAIQLHLRAQDDAIWGWPAWPEALKDPTGAGAHAFQAEHADAVAHRMWLQWIAHEQLAQASGRARALMPMGLYCDLAVGSSDGGSETWMNPGLYARGMNVGAPPDPLSLQGQDWGLPPVNPVALLDAELLPLRRLIATAMRHCGALRLDHVMGLMRLYWQGSHGGTYVHYPLQAQLAVLRVESHRLRCMVIGEDLGNVAPAMREAMAQHDVLSYRPLIFERLEGGAFRPPEQWHRQALAVVTTHDLPTLTGFWAADDIAIQHRLGWLSEGDAHVQALVARAQGRTQLLAALDSAGLLPEGLTLDPHSAPTMTPALAAAVHALLAMTPCQLVGVQLEDLTGQLHQPNVPGTMEDVHPNWRRRMGTPLEQLAADPFFVAITTAVRAQRARTAIAGQAELPPLETADVPLATYRVQMHAGFTFQDATAIVPYLQALGISHLYTSPYLQAARGSTHGYDVVDPSRLNAEIGTEADHTALCAALSERGMGHVLDTVPNHMGIDDAANRWWQDVLEHGQASPHATRFDIEWNPPTPQTGHRVLLPVLGDHYGQVLEAGELQVRFEEAAGKLHLAYWERSIPLDPRCYATLLGQIPLPVPGPEIAASAVAELQSLIDAFAALPPQDTPDAGQRAARLRDAPLLQQRLARLAVAHGWVAGWIGTCLGRINGTVGEPASFDVLDRVLGAQAYRLADWRVAGDDINYRRFFDVNSLAAIRMEDPDVFEAVHALPLRWAAEGKLTGLRIDHPDGLADPAEYFERLQRRHLALQQAAGIAQPRALYVLVEKIMADHEPLPADWHVHGGTGYRFSTLVTGLFIAAEAQADFDAHYAEFTGDTQAFDEAGYECKRLIIQSALACDLNWLVDTLSRITRADRAVCDFTRNQLRLALVEVAAFFPVYRTYIVPGKGPASEADRRHIAWAIAAARRRIGTSEGGVLAYLQSILLGEEGAAPELRARFIRRWQQFTAPVMAKSIEDTLFYRYTRLVSLNDVGAEPRRFGLSVAAFHQANQQRARYLPHSMLGTSTHDSKRSEDVRARLNVLSEMPHAWKALVHDLEALGQRFCTTVDGTDAPSRHDLWSLCQAMVGIWPVQRSTAEQRKSLVERLQQYMVKAMREAKLATNWLFPNEAYESAVTQYIEKTLSSERFVSTLEDFVQRVAPQGFRNSLCQLALKLTVPGVPDIYQGCEVWNFSLVDPDNRRPVQFGPLADSLASVQSMYAQGRFPAPAEWRQVLGEGAQMPDAAKQLVTWRLLQLRQRFPALFRDSTYLPLPIDGGDEAADARALAFARIREGEACVVVSSRLTAQQPPAEGTGAGTGATLDMAQAHPALAKPGRWLNWLTGETFVTDRPWPISSLLGSCNDGTARLPRLPFAVLIPVQSDA